MKKRILAITGKRGGYEAMLPLLYFLEKDKRLEITLILCDQHYMQKFGRTHDKIDFPHVGVCPITEEDFPLARAKNLGRYVSELAAYFTIKKPDLILLYGDRGEVAAAALAAATLEIPVAHLQAGDTTGNVDDIYRGMISQTANLLFTSCDKYRDDLLKSNYQPERIFVAGDQHLDGVRISRYNDKAKLEVCQALGFEKQREALGIIILHPGIGGAIHDENVVNNTLSACTSYSMIQWVAIYPCSDPGHQMIIDKLREHREKVNNLSLHKNIPSKVFHWLLYYSELIVGNSSCGIIEAPFLGTPSIDIGTRQNGRTKSASIYSAPCGNYREIEQGISKCIKYDSFFNVYFGNGKAYVKIGEVIVDAFFGHLQYLLEPKYR